METAKKIVGAIFGFAEDETNLFLASVKRSILNILPIVTRVMFIIAFVYCLFFYTTVGFVLLVLAYYLIELEREVETLKRKVRDLG